MAQPSLVTCPPVSKNDWKSDIYTFVMFSFYIKLRTYLRNPVLLFSNMEENTKSSTNDNGFNPF